jgi:hypothetical protein
MSTPNSTSTAVAAGPLYTILTQVKSARVVYFTDDPAYIPPVDGDWYFASSYRGALPNGMTLRNCWSWRFNGSDFVDAKAEGHVPKAQALLEHNRRALMRILTDKIDELRKPYVAQALLGNELRRLKLDEARAYLSDPTSRERYGVLEAVAVSRNISMLVAAELIIKRAGQMEEMLIATERIRERFSSLIEQATSDKDLLSLRSALLQDVYPELSRKLRFVPPNTEPRDSTAPLADHHRMHEIGRLKAQLRERINKERSKVDSDYLGHTEALKFKAQIARWVLAPTGEAPRGIDLLEGYAQGRGLVLEEAARQIFVELVSAGRVLLNTERMKDRLLADIESIRTLADIQRIETELADHDRLVANAHAGADVNINK